MVYTQVSVSVTDQVMTLDACPKLASGGVDVVRIDFTFCPMWEGFAKTAVFYRPGGKAYHVLLVDDKAVVPQEVLTHEGSVMFSVFGVNAEGQTRPANVLELKVERGAITEGIAVKDPTPSVYEQIMAQLAELENGGGTGGGAVARISYVDLPASGWQGEQSPYSQVVAVEGATENSQVDLTPSAEQLAIFHNKDLAFVTENEDGVVTVYAVGQKPTNDYTIQVTITEVVR